MYIKPCRPQTRDYHSPSRDERSLEPHSHYPNSKILVHVVPCWYWARLALFPMEAIYLFSLHSSNYWPRALFRCWCSASRSIHHHPDYPKDQYESLESWPWWTRSRAVRCVWATKDLFLVTKALFRSVVCDRIVSVCSRIRNETKGIARGAESRACLWWSWKGWLGIRPRQVSGLGWSHRLLWRRSPRCANVRLSMLFEQIWWGKQGWHTLSKPIGCKIPKVGQSERSTRGCMMFWRQRQCQH